MGLRINPDTVNVHAVNHWKLPFLIFATIDGTAPHQVPCHARAKAGWPKPGWPLNKQTFPCHANLQSHGQGTLLLRGQTNWPQIKLNTPDPPTLAPSQHFSETFCGTTPRRFRSISLLRAKGSIDHSVAVDCARSALTVGQRNSTGVYHMP
jgi:hypothetical protein